MEKMKQNFYEVHLKGYINEVWAFSEEQATILVQAMAIKQGVDYELLSVRKIK
jgi:hypothetical protein